MKSINKDKVNLILVLCSFLICMAAACFVCTNKSGFHVDEYYSFYSSNRTEGLFIEDKMNMPTKILFNEMTVIPGEGFNFGLVKEVQSWDVHPPIYYFLIHLVCSLTPDALSMWQGLIINLICLGISFWLLKWLGDILFPKYKNIVTLVVLAWGISSATLSGVVFIRMYMLLTVWVFAVTILHVKASDLRASIFYPLLGVVTFLGFMTHYYFFIWLFFLAVLYNLKWILETRKIRNTLLYGITMIVTFGICYVFYPAFPAQMFRGQRGSQATGNFFDLSNTWERLCFFGEKINRIGFGGLLFAYIIFIIVLIIVSAVRAKMSKTKMQVNSHLIILGLALLGYFCVVAKTALMLGDTSIRYHMPVIGIAYLVIMGYILETIQRLSKNDEAGSIGKRMGILIGSLVGVILIANVISDCKGNISFLYPEQKEQIAYMRQYENCPVVYAYNPDQTWCVWDSAMDLLEHDEVYFLSGFDSDISQSEELINVDEVLLFVDNAVDSEAVIHNVESSNSHISTHEPLYETEYYTVYLCRS